MYSARAVRSGLVDDIATGPAIAVGLVAAVAGLGWAWLARLLAPVAMALLVLLSAAGVWAAVPDTETADRGAGRVVAVRGVGSGQWSIHARRHSIVDAVGRVGVDRVGGRARVGRSMGRGRRARFAARCAGLFRHRAGGAMDRGDHRWHPTRDVVVACASGRGSGSRSVGNRRVVHRRRGRTQCCGACRADGSGRGQLSVDRAGTPTTV